MSEESEGKIHSGCTAVTAFIRIEDASGHQSFLSPPSTPGAESPISGHSLDNTIDEDASSAAVDLTSHQTGPSEAEVQALKKAKKEKSSSRSRLRRALQSLSGGSSKVASSSTPDTASVHTSQKSSADGHSVIIPPSDSRHVLYSANAGDARGVLCRAGKAVRLTYDHKGSDKQEAKRITDAGGFVMGGRVNGVLAVTRSLGDSSMKEFVVGAPYTTETQLCEDDEFLILACDGVSNHHQLSLLVYS